MRNHSWIPLPMKLIISKRSRVLREKHPYFFSKNSLLCYYVSMQLKTFLKSGDRFDFCD